jgi:transposase
VAEHIERTFGVRYHVDHICRLLHAMHWGPQRPVRKASCERRTRFGAASASDSLQTKAEVCALRKGHKGNLLTRERD